MGLFGLFKKKEPPSSIEDLRPEPPMKKWKPEILGEYYNLVVVKQDTEKVWAEFTDQGKKRLDELETVDDVIEFMRTFQDMCGFKCVSNLHPHGPVTKAADLAAYSVVVKRLIELIKLKRDTELKSKW